MVNVIKLFFFVVDVTPKYARVFVLTIFVPVSFYTSSPIGEELESMQLNIMDFIIALDFTQIPANFGRLGL